MSDYARDAPAQQLLLISAAPTPNVKYGADITYLPLATGTKLVRGHGDRLLLTVGSGGRSLSKCAPKLVADALKAAAALRGALAGAMLRGGRSG